MNPTVRGAEDRGRQAETTEGSDEPWWKTAVLYQVYLRSFADADDDGVGDLRGLIGHLDHLEWLGVDGLWLSPVTPSPNADWGYDVSDFRAVHPDFGTLDELDRLVAEAGRRGMRILLDLVPNHTSDEHPWFLEAASSRLAERRDWYVWADAKPDGSPPNNWVSSFGGPAWTLHPDTGQYFLHNHLERQPDLNWWNDEVRDAFDGILRFWLDRGVAGFRIDVCNIIIKDADLRDNPPATEDDDFEAQMFGQRPVYNANRPEVHEVIRRWRALTETYTRRRGPDRRDARPGRRPGLLLRVRRTSCTSPSTSPSSARPSTHPRCVRSSRRPRRPCPPGPGRPGPAPTTTCSASRPAGPATTRDAPASRLLMLLCLRGTPVLYQGDEIGLGDVTLAQEDLRDPLGVRYWPYYAGRDAGRTPMPWRPGPGGGFTAAGVRPWLPLGDTEASSVERQRSDPDSMLHLARDLIALRRTTADLRLGRYRTLGAPDGAWAWSRGDTVVVALNLTDDEVDLPGVEGVVRLGTDRRRDGETISAGLRLGAWEGLVVERSVPSG